MTVDAVMVTWFTVIVESTVIVKVNVKVKVKEKEKEKEDHHEGDLPFFSSY
jgi:hypothetical protein